jgi:hypothetical protein
LPGVSLRLNDIIEASERLRRLVKAVDPIVLNMRLTGSDPEEP